MSNGNIYKMLFGNDNIREFWLGSSFVNSGGSGSLFGIRTVQSGRIYNKYWISTYNKISTYSCNVCPAVTLKSDVTITDENGTYKIN